MTSLMTYFAAVCQSWTKLRSSIWTDLPVFLPAVELAWYWWNNLKSLLEVTSSPQGHHGLHRTTVIKYRTPPSSSNTIRGSIGIQLVPSNAWHMQGHHQPYIVLGANVTTARVTYKHDTIKYTVSTARVTYKRQGFQHLLLSSMTINDQWSTIATSL